jgi:hypothetical protein
MLNTLCPHCRNCTASYFHRLFFQIASMLGQGLKCSSQRCASCHLKLRTVRPQPSLPSVNPTSESREKPENLPEDEWLKWLRRETPPAPDEPIESLNLTDEQLRENFQKVDTSKLSDEWWQRVEKAFGHVKREPWSQI